jgi:hypothetical protein
MSRHGPRTQHDEGSTRCGNFGAEWHGLGTGCLRFVRRITPDTTQDSLLVAGQALPGGIGYPQGSYEKFPRCVLHLILLSQAFPGAGCVPFFLPAFTPGTRQAFNQGRAQGLGGWWNEVRGRTGSPAQLPAGQAFEAQQLADLNLEKNTEVWRPTPAQTESAAFRVIVGKPKYTEGGLLRGTIFDATEGGLLEIKGGSSLMGSSYQFRLQVYRSLLLDVPLTIRTTRPINPTFADWLTRWGVTIQNP